MKEFHCAPIPETHVAWEWDGDIQSLRDYLSNEGSGLYASLGVPSFSSQSIWEEQQDVIFHNNGVETLLRNGDFIVHRSTPLYDLAGLRIVPVENGNAMSHSWFIVDKDLFHTHYQVMAYGVSVLEDEERSPGRYPSKYGKRAPGRFVAEKMKTTPALNEVTSDTE